MWNQNYAIVSIVYLQSSFKERFYTATMMFFFLSNYQCIKIN